MSTFSQFFGGGGGFDLSVHSVGGGLKPSIILFDTRPGTRTFTVPEGVTKIRAFVVGGGGAETGGGGGYSEKEYIVSGNDVFDYTVGAYGDDGDGGTSSFNSEITATGGEKQGSGGAGSGGDINSDGGDANYSSGDGGGSSGNRFGDGQSGENDGGAGWGGDDPPSNPSNKEGGGSGGIDGFGIGLVPGALKGGDPGQNTLAGYADNLGYGCGGFEESNGGIGGGGGTRGSGGIGGGGGNQALGGFGVVGVEVLETE